MSNPTIIGRLTGSPSSDELLDPRAATRLAAESKEDFWGYNEGAMQVALYQSVGDEDRGGMVLTLSSDGDENFCPHVVQTARGIELHIAGDGEADAAVRALIQVLQKWVRPPNVDDWKSAR